MAVEDVIRTAEEIQQDVLAELKWDPRVSPNEIGVSVTDRVVTLTGWVDSYVKRWAAEEAAHRVRGVKAVANEIEVRLPISSERTDAEIARTAIGALESNAVLKAEDIQVTVSNGWVTLKGSAEWNFQKEDAERAVRHLWGVKGVTNLVLVRARPTPQELKKEIEKALIRNAEADAKNIDVEVQGSKVILKGQVRAWAERQEAERVAWTSPGVTAVEDQIVVASYTAP